jgi:hypothetical protein
VRSLRLRTIYATFPVSEGLFAEHFGPLRDDEHNRELPNAFVIEDGESDCDVVPTVVRGEIASDLLRDDGFGHVGEFWDADYEDRKRPAKTIRELCELCGWPINLVRSWSACEFTHQPGIWWRGDHWQFCRCNGCLCSPTGSMGRPKYCSDKCRHRVKLAWERGHRRAEGAVSWSFDDDADRLVSYRLGIRQLANQRRASDYYPRW